MLYNLFINLISGVWVMVRAWVMAGLMGLANVVALTTPEHVYASEVSGKATLNDVQIARIELQKLSTSYALYALENRRPSDLDAIKTLKADISKRLRAVHTPTMQQSWSMASEIVMMDPYTDGKVDTDMLTHLNILTEALEKELVHQVVVVKTKEGIPAQRRADKLADLAVSMEQVTNTYFQLAATDQLASKKAQLTKAIREFNVTLSQTQNTFKTDSRMQAELDDIAQKWRFMRMQLQAEKQGSLTFLMTAYNQQITGKLQQHFERLAK